MRQIEPHHHVVVVGAGPAGLTAAYLLSQAGFRTTVLEAGEAMGGISRTARYKEYRFDLGGHRFFTKLPSVSNLWRELLGSELIKVPRLSRIHYRGHFFDYPLRAGNALRGLGTLTTVRVLLSYLRWRVRPYPVEDTFEEWVTNRFGRCLFEIFFKTYTEKVWGMPCAEISADWAAQRIQGFSLAKAILTATPLQRRSMAIRTLIHEFEYPQLGPGQMWETCAARIVEMGNLVERRHAVLQIEQVNGRVQAVVVDTMAGRRRIAADHVISSMPLQQLVAAITPAVTPAATSAAAELRYRDFIAVALILDRTDLFPDNWVYVHTPGVKVGRIQNVNNWSAAMVPPGRTCLCLEYFCFEGDDLWRMADDWLIAMATGELVALGLAGGAAVVDGTVVRVPKAYPVYDATYRDRINRIRQAIDPVDNLHTVGRNGLHKYNNQDHSMLTAMMTVANMQGGSRDVWATNTDYEYHEALTLDPVAEDTDALAS